MGNLRRPAAAVLLVVAVATAACTSERSTVGACHDPAPPAPGAGDFDPALSDFVDTQAGLLRERFAGSWMQGDGTALVGLTEGPVPETLATRPDVRVVTRRHSAAQLDAVMETVTRRLNPLLNPGVAPGTPGKWPYWASVDLVDNVVTVCLDRTQKGRLGAVEKALATELDSDVVRLGVGDVPSVGY